MNPPCTSPPGTPPTGSLASLVLAAFAAAATAQTPQDAPPWWGVQDDVTVSLYWSFDPSFPAGQPTAAPTFAVTPSWYSNPTPWTAGANVVWIPTLAGHVGVAGLVGTGAPQQADLDLFVDNDPHLNWIKIFWFQFDAFDGASGTVSQAIAQDLADYGRAAVTETREDIGNGWTRYTVSAELIPQPDDETIEWTFTENALGTVAIDDLYVSSKCVKPRPDEDGVALGLVTTPPIDLALATGGLSARAAAVTRGSAASPGKRYWISAIDQTPAAALQIVQLNNVGTATGNTPLPSTTLQAPLGATDLAVETVDLGGGQFQEWVYAIVDRRASGGDVVVRALDANANGALAPALDVTLTGFPAALAPQRFGLAFDPSGDLGAGTFWVTAPLAVTPQGNSPAFEFDRQGNLRRTGQVPLRTGGLAYDDTLGNFYGFSAEPLPSPSGPVQVNGYEISGYTFEQTGVRFCGDLTLPNPGGPRGGVAAGLDAYRTFGTTRNELRLVCVADAGGTQWLYELAGPFRYGYSRFGTCGMQDGPPFLGGAFSVTLRGVPTSVLAMLFLGSTDIIVPLGPGPNPEAFASLLPDVSSAFVAPTAPGEFALPIALPNTASLGYAEVFFQWLVLDATAPGLLGFSQAGKTVLYP